MDSNRFSYHISATAESDIDGIVGYIALELGNSVAAKSLYENLIEKFQNLCDMPRIGHIVENDFERRIDVRWLAVKNYILYYLINDKDKTINVLRVVSARRDQNQIIGTMMK